jgi:hypothetical protein
MHAIIDGNSAAMGAGQKPVAVAQQPVLPATAIRQQARMFTHRSGSLAVVFIAMSITRINPPTQAFSATTWSSHGSLVAHQHSVLRELCFVYQRHCSMMTLLEA